MPRIGRHRRRTGPRHRRHPPAARRVGGGDARSDPQRHPGIGMPAFPMPDAELDALVAYVDLLKAPAADHPAGRRRRGRRTLLHREGELLELPHGARPRRHPRAGPVQPRAASDGRRRSSRRSASRAPAGRPGAGAEAVTRRRPSGRLRAHARRPHASRPGQVREPFDLGVQSLDGRFHSISRSEVAEITWEPSLMPKWRRRPTRCATCSRT